MTIDPISLAITPVSLCLKDMRLAQGTGFFMAHVGPPEGYFLSLVTNYHVVTGFAPGKGRSPIGDRIRFEIRTRGSDPTQVRDTVYPLETKQGKPTWFASTSQPDADLAVVPLPLSQPHFETAPYAFDKAAIDLDLAPYPGEAVVVVGYPLGWRDRVNRLPLWKTGHIASEPQEEFDGKPRFLIDITGREGMSGSPVLAGHRDMYFPKTGAPKFGGSGALLGLFASTALQYPGNRPGSDDFPSGGPSGTAALGDRPELGFVWKARLITQVLEGLSWDTLVNDVFSDLPKL